MTKRNCFSCGTVFEDHISYFKCTTCQQTEKMSKLYKEQNRLIEEQNRIARQQAPQQYYAESSLPAHYHSPEPQMKKWDAPPVTLQKKYSTLDKIISHCLVLFNYTITAFIFLLPPILLVLSGWIIWILSGKLLWLFALIPLWFVLLVPIFEQLRSLHYEWQKSLTYYLSVIPDNNDFPVYTAMLFYDTW